MMNNLNNFYRKSEQECGFIALISIIIVTVIALGVAGSVSLLGIGEAKNSLDHKKGYEVLNLADACAEDTLLRTRNESDYVGGVLNFENGSCSVSVSTTTEGKLIVIDASLTGPPIFSKSLTIDIRKDGNGVTVVSWRESI